MINCFLPGSLCAEVITVVDDYLTSSTTWCYNGLFQLLSLCDGSPDLPNHVDAGWIVKQELRKYRVNTWKSQKSLNVSFRPKHTKTKLYHNTTQSVDITLMLRVALNDYVADITVAICGGQQDERRGIEDAAAGLSGDLTPADMGFSSYFEPRTSGRSSPGFSLKVWD